MEDMAAPVGANGLINIRVGAIILKDGRLLMVGTDYSDYLYSVGGHLEFGETSAQAVRREVEEETGVRLEIDRLGFIHESYYRGESPKKRGRDVYEISFYYYMVVPPDFEPVRREFHEGTEKEHLEWVRPDDPRRIFPAFYRKEVFEVSTGVRHIVTHDL